MEALTERKPEYTLQLIDQLNQHADGLKLPEQVKKSHASWTLKYLHFYAGRLLTHLGKHEVEAFLSYLAKDLNLDQEKQRSAERTLRFLYQQILNVALGDLHFLRLKQRRGFFSRFGETHCAAVVCHLRGPSQLMAKLAVATHLKLREVVNLRVADIDLKKSQILVRHLDQRVNYIVNIPVQMILELRIQVMKVNHLVRQELEMSSAESRLSAAAPGQSSQDHSPYLFPYRYANQGLAGDNPTPLSMLKNDIRLAIQNYLRFIPDPHRAAGQILIPAMRPSKRQRNHERRLMANRNHQHSVQRSFDFFNELGAA